MSYVTEQEKRKIKSFIAGAGYSITSLAKEIGMTRESLSARINGKIDFEREEMNKIADKVGANPADIFFAIGVSSNATATQ